MAPRRRRSAYSSYAPRRRNVRQIGSRVFERRRRRYRRRGREVNRTAPAFWYDVQKKRFYSSPLFTESRRSRRLDVRMLMVAAPNDFRVHKNGDVYFRGVSLEWNVKKRPNPPARLRSETLKRLRTIEESDLPNTDEGKYLQEVLVSNTDFEVVSAAINDEGELVAIFRNVWNGKMFTVNTETPARLAPWRKRRKKNGK